jgi:DNA-binding MarR family transcriptional regulator
MSISSLARELALDPSTVNRQVRPLREEGLVDPPPGRVGSTTELRLTPSGEKVLAKMDNAWLGDSKRLMSQLSASDRKVLAGLLDQLQAVMEADLETMTYSSETT